MNLWNLVYILYLDHISVCSSIFLGLSSRNMWVVAIVMDSPGLEIQLNGFIITDKYLHGTTLQQVLCWRCSQEINQTLMEHESLLGEVHKKLYLRYEQKVWN